MYKLKNDPLTGQPCVVIRVADHANIPLDNTNQDYQEYLKWIDGYKLQGTEWIKTSDGNTPLLADN